MRKHGTITACAGVERLPPIPNRQERARAAKPSERRPPFWKARSRRQELQGPQVPRRRQTQKRQRRIALSIPHLSCEICTFERGSPVRNRAFFIKSGGGREKSGRLPGNRNAIDLALCLQVVRGHTAQGGDGVFRGLPVDEFRPISGRSPLLFCHGRSQRQRLLGRAACRAEQPRAVGDARRTTARSRGGALGRASPLGQDVAGAKSCRQALADAALARTPSARTTTSPAQIPQSTSSPFLPKRPVSSGETPINEPVPTVVSGH